MTACPCTLQQASSKSSPYLSSKSLTCLSFLRMADLPFPRANPISVAQPTRAGRRPILRGLWVPAFAVSGARVLIALNGLASLVYAWRDSLDVFRTNAALNPASVITMPTGGRHAPSNHIMGERLPADIPAVEPKDGVGRSASRPKPATCVGLRRDKPHKPLDIRLTH